MAIIRVVGDATKGALPNNGWRAIVISLLVKTFLSRALVPLFGGKHLGVGLSATARRSSEVGGERLRRLAGRPALRLKAPPRG